MSTKNVNPVMIFFLPSLDFWGHFIFTFMRFFLIYSFFNPFKSILEFHKFINPNRIGILHMKSK